MSKIFSRIKLTYLFTNRYLSLARLVLLQLLLMLRPGWSKVEIKLYQRCFSVVSTLYTDVVSTLCNVENPTSDFVSFSTSDQCYFNVDPQRWNNVDPTLKCWLGYHVPRGARQLLLNWKRLSYFRPFTPGIITQNTNHRNIMYLYRGHSAGKSIGKGEGEYKESNRKWHRKEGVQSKKIISLTQILLCTFFCNSVFIPSWFVMKPWCYSEH